MVEKNPALDLHKTKIHAISTRMSEGICSLPLVEDALAMQARSLGFILPAHSNILKFIENADAEQLEPSLRLALFKYVFNAVSGDAEAKGYIRTADYYEDPVSGMWWSNIPAINEELYSREIGIMQRLREGLVYSDALRRIINDANSAITDCLMCDPDFRDVLRQWSSLTTEEKRQNAAAFLYVSNSCTQDVSGLSFEPAPFFFVDWPDLNGFRAYHSLPGAGTEETDPVSYVVGHEEKCCDMDAQGFFGVLAHEAVHAAIFQFALNFFHGNRYESDALNNDARLRLLKARYPTGNLILLNTLYFSDDEEKICYARQRKMETSIEKYLKLTQSAAPLKPYAPKCP